MRIESIALNYAEALFELGERRGNAVAFGDLMDALAFAVQGSPRVQSVLMSPRITKAEKAQLLKTALPGAPADFVGFLQAVVKRGRQALFPEIAKAYFGLLDVKFNRLRASVVVAREPDEALRKSIADALGRVMGKEVIPSYDVDPEILGGAIVRVGDRILDGSLRRRLARLRWQLLAH